MAPARTLDVLALVAPNGVGHLRRVVGVVSRMLDREPGLSVGIACDPTSAATLRSWPRAAALLDRAELHHGVMEPGVAWTTDPSRYADGRLRSWEQELAGLEALDRAVLVISDNLAAPLELRSDTVMLGSFLASDVLAAAYPHDPHVGSFVLHERRLLAACRPPMLCVGDMATAGVLTRTDAVRLPWMCEFAPMPTTSTSAGRVAVLGGRTAAADDLLAASAAALADAGFDVVDQAGFGFQPEDYASVDIAVCRPGLGTVNDCIAQRVPMVLLHEGNSELSHNAVRLASMGLGEDLGSVPPPEQVVAAVQRVLEPKRWLAIRDRMAALDCDGLDKAADWLLHRWSRLATREHVGHAS